MASYLYKLISSSDLPIKSVYCFRFAVDDESLAASVRKHGILQPLIVTPRSRELLSGHKRLAAVRALGIPSLPVLELQEEPAPQDAFLIAVLSNWSQPFSELEKAHIVFAAKQTFGFEENQILDEIFPALNINPGKGFYREALEVMSLQPEVLDLIAKDQLPFRGARAVCHFRAEDQRTFAAFAREASLSTNQLLKTAEWIFDLLKMGKISLHDFLNKNQFDAILNADYPRNVKGERAFSKIRALRFPNIAEKEKQFLGVSAQFRDEKSGLTIEWPPYFEGEGFTLKANLKNPDSLEAVLSAIHSKRKVLNSLLDIVL